MADTAKPTGMIDTDITFNPKTMDWYFAIDGVTWTFAKESDARDALAGVLYRKRMEDHLARSRKQPLPSEVVDDDWQPVSEVAKARRIREYEKAVRRGEKPPLITDHPDQKPTTNASNDLAALRWDQVQRAYLDGKEAGYEPEEIGETLYDLVKQLLSEQGIG